MDLANTATPMAMRHRFSGVSLGTTAVQHFHPVLGTHPCAGDPSGERFA
jgi:hypothetical protein